MADTVTANFGYTKPENQASDDTWGVKTNANWDKLDAYLQTLANRDASIEASRPWERIVNTIFTGASSVVIPNVQSYRMIRIVARVWPASAVPVHMQMSLDGSSYRTGASDYIHVRAYDAGTSRVVASDQGVSVPLSAGGNVGQGQGAAMLMDGLFHGPTAASEAGRMFSRASWLNGSTEVTSEVGARTSFAGIIRAIRILATSGTITGHCYAEGIRL